MDSKTHSAYASPTVYIRKKCGDLRLCIDYRRLNNKTIPGKQPILKMQDILDSFGGQEWYSTVDMSKAYHQDFIKEECRKFTAFSTPWALHEWIRIPYGLTNATPCFQRYMKKCLGGLQDLKCIAYFDDILIYGQTCKEHLENLEAVLKRLKEKGIKLNAKKCHFFKREVKYLGRLIFKDRYKADPQDSIALEKFRAPPKTVGEVRSLLGFLGYYRCYVKNFSKILKPLYDLLKKDITKPKLKKTKTSKKKETSQLDSKTVVEWTEQHQLILNETLGILKSPELCHFLILRNCLWCIAMHQKLGWGLFFVKSKMGN